MPVLCFWVRSTTSQTLCHCCSLDEPAFQLLLDATTQDVIRAILSFFIHKNDSYGRDIIPLVCLRQLFNTATHLYNNLHWECGHTDECNAMIVQDTAVYGMLALLFLLTIILLGVDLGSNVLAEFIPQSTTRVHIAALVFLLTLLNCCLFRMSVSVRHWLETIFCSVLKHERLAFPLENGKKIVGFTLYPHS